MHKFIPKREWQGFCLIDELLHGVETVIPHVYQIQSQVFNRSISLPPCAGSDRQAQGNRVLLSRE